MWIGEPAGIDEIGRERVLAGFLWLSVDIGVTEQTFVPSGLFPTFGTLGFGLR